MTTKTMDQAYLKGLINRDPRIIQEIYNKFYKGIKAHILHNKGTEIDAQDVFQEGMVVLYRNFNKPDFELTSAFNTYLYAVCKRIWLRKLKKSWNKEVTIPEDIELKDDSSIEKDMEKTEQYKLFRTKMAQLGEDCQKVLKLFFDKVKMEEIAKIMNFGSVSYAKKRKHQCKEKLVSLIKQDPLYAELTT